MSNRQIKLSFSGLELRFHFPPAPDPEALLRPQPALSQCIAVLLVQLFQPNPGRHPWRPLPLFYLTYTVVSTSEYSRNFTTSRISRAVTFWVVFNCKCPSFSIMLRNGLIEHVTIISFFHHNLSYNCKNHFSSYITVFIRSNWCFLALIVDWCPHMKWYL